MDLKGCEDASDPDASTTTATDSLVQCGEKGEWTYGTSLSNQYDQAGDSCHPDLWMSVRRFHPQSVFGD